jgi:predicted MPP superfamily phosphohydrolase
MFQRFRRILILAALWVYTTFKIVQVWPNHIIISTILVYCYFAVMIGWMFLYHAKPALIHKLWFRSFAWVGSFAMGLWATFILFAMMTDVGFLIFKILSFLHIFPAYSLEPIILKTDVGLMLLAVLITLLGFAETLRGPKVKNVALTIPNLPPALNNLKIAQLSDLHIGPTIRKSYIERVVLRTNATHPDLIVVTGDLADAKAKSITQELAPLGNLMSRLGTYYVTGNHEYYWDATGLINAVAALGFIPLINENRIVDFNGAKILIAGVTDNIGGGFLKGHAPDLVKAAATQEVPDLKILLAHRPDPYIEAEKLGFNLQFAGHTHAGQFFPFNVLLPLAYKYYRRLNHFGNLWLHVNPGTGYWGPANRFGVPSEITLLTLRTS